MGLDMLSSRMSRVLICHHSFARAGGDARVKEGFVPTYQYTCTECGEPVEAVQKFTDEPLTVCAVCGGKLRKVFSPVGIVFKGSGFYRTDSRKSSGSSVVPAEKPSGDGASSSKESDSSKKQDAGSSGTESKPAAKTSGETVSTPSKSSSASEKVA